MFHIEIKGLGQVSVDTLEELDSLKMRYLNPVPELKSESVAQIPVVPVVEDEKPQSNEMRLRKGTRQRTLLSALCVPVIKYLGYIRRTEAIEKFKENFVNISFKLHGKTGLFTNYGPISRLPVWLKDEIVRLNHLHSHKTCILYLDTAGCVNALRKLIESKIKTLPPIDAAKTPVISNSGPINILVSSKLDKVLHEVSFPVFSRLNLQGMTFQEFYQKFMQTKHRDRELVNDALDGIINPKVYERLKFYLPKYYKNPTQETLMKIRSRITSDLEEIAKA